MKCPRSLSRKYFKQRPPAPPDADPDHQYAEGKCDECGQWVHLVTRGHGALTQQVLDNHDLPEAS